MLILLLVSNVTMSAGWKVKHTGHCWKYYKKINRFNTVNDLKYYDNYIYIYTLIKSITQY